MQTAEPRGNRGDATRGTETKGTAGTEKTSKAMELLEEGITRITTSEEFKRYLSFTRSFRKYSPNNIMLIFLQRPDATMVAGYRKWQEHGRQVKKGEKAIKVLAPVLRKVEDEENGEVVKKVVGFRDANVFAYESTEGEPLPTSPMTGTVAAGAGSGERLYSALSRVCEAEGVPVTEAELGPGHYGYHDPRSGRIVISSAIPEVRKATTLAHELCHYFLHPLHVSLTEDTGTKETEAEGASYAICGHFGVDTEAFSFPYIARHAEDPKVLQGVIGRIHEVVGKVLDYGVHEAAEVPDSSDTPVAA
jgi:hypothetical protein